MSAGFYKPEGETFFYAPNYVHAPTYSLVKEAKEQYVYPNNGWVWCDSIEEAIDILNIRLPEFTSIDDYRNNTTNDYPFIYINGQITQV